MFGSMQEENQIALELTEFVPPVSTTTSRGRTQTVLRTSCCCGVLLCSPSSRSPHPSWSVSCMKTPKRLPAPHWTVSLVSRIVIALFQVLQLEQITDSITTLRKAFASGFEVENLGEQLEIQRGTLLIVELDPF